jgi:L-arabinose 1-dehydrogenase [NAD(P)+]
MGPDSYYGVSKVTGEALADYYAETHGLEFVNLRIGWYLSAERLRELQAEPDSVARYARAMFLSPRDCRDILRRAAEADLPENPLTVNVTSRNANRYLSLTEAIRSLGYEPRDDAAKVLAE